MQSVIYRKIYHTKEFEPWVILTVQNQWGDRMSLRQYRVGVEPLWNNAGA